MGIEISKVYNARVYIDGRDFIGKAEEVDLPKVKLKFSEIKGLGLYGETEVPSALDKMEARLKFNSIYPEFVALAADPFTLRSVIVRASQQVWSQRGVEEERPIKAEMRGFFKEWDGGSIKKGDGAEAEAQLSVVYYKLEVDGIEIVEIDVFNNIYRIEGRDILAPFKQNIGG